MFAMVFSKHCLHDNPSYFFINNYSSTDTLFARCCWNWTRIQKKHSEATKWKYDELLHPAVVLRIQTMKCIRENLCNRMEKHTPIQISDTKSMSSSVNQMTFINVINPLCLATSIGTIFIYSKCICKSQKCWLIGRIHVNNSVFSTE